MRYRAAVPKTNPAPGERSTTLRESLRRALLDGWRSARDLSQAVGISERDVAEHLEHLEHSLRHRGETLAIDPAACLACGFVFAERQRHRFTRPSGCPQCRGRRISVPRFHVESHRG
jgi:transcriptional regulator